MKEIGLIKIVQLQPSGLIIRSAEGSFYDPSRRMEVDSLEITPLGVSAVSPQGERLLDIHHLDHPDKAYDSRDLICIGFTPHYEAMRGRFGKHMTDGVAGENIIIETEQELWLSDLGQGIAVENQETSERTRLNLVRYASPCRAFSHFAARSQERSLPAEELKEILHFLDRGRRGFLLVMAEGQEPAVIRPGDRVFALDT